MEEGAHLFNAFTNVLNVTWDAPMTALAGGAGNSSAFLDILLVVVLILVNGFFAAAEMAIVTLNDNWVRKNAEDGDVTAKKLLPFIDNPGNFLATIQVGVTIAGFLSSSFGAERFAPRLAKLVSDNPSRVISNLSLILVTLVIAYFSLVLGELVPKQIALNNPYGFSKMAVGIIRVFDVIMRPFTWFLNLSTKVALKILRINPEEGDSTSTEEEIRMIIDVGRDSGNIQLAEKEMIVNVFDFNDKEVSEIMTHRTSVVALPLTAGYDEVVDVAVHERYSRIPVYEEDIDHIVGVLHIKDLLYYLAEKRPEDRSDHFVMSGLLRAPYFVPESRYVDQVFRDMQRDRITLAIVIDEYGGTAGIVSMEDLVEELVGNIQDEYDEEDRDIEQVGEHEYIVNGLLPLEDLEKALDDVIFGDDDDDDYDTVAGFVLGLLDRIPEEHEKVKVDYRNLTFQVLQMDDKRIAKLLLTINQPVERPDDTEDDGEESEGKAEEE